MSRYTDTGVLRHKLNSSHPESYLGAAHAHAHTSTRLHVNRKPQTREHAVSVCGPCTHTRAITLTSLRHPHTPPGPQLSQREDTDTETTGTQKHTCGITQGPWDASLCVTTSRCACEHVSVSTRQAHTCAHSGTLTLGRVLVAAHSAGTWALLWGTGWVTHGHGL